MRALPLLLGLALASPLAAQNPAAQPYFQQDVAYRIEARLDDRAEVLHGRARMRYLNRSPATLDTLYFNLFLNAFRPNSAWARRELEFGNRRFQDLGPDEWGYERLKSVTIGGKRVTPIFPIAPDSTVVAFALPQPLAPGDSLTVDMDWDARPSTLPRRQGRRGRHYDFAQWFPIVAVYDRDGWEVRPLLPQGEFYGEFMRFDVTLDLARDQVMAATGVPVEGDPGWAGAAAAGFADSLFYKRDVYGPTSPAERLGLLQPRAASGRKHVRWRANDVHNFAWTTAPEYTYEGGHWEDVAIHVLYQPGDTAWSGGQALDRTKIALTWLDSIYGDFAWPQLSNVHRIEGGGTEFPMMVMNGGASLGLILHEVGHNYTMGILANNEWKQGFLDEGFTSFQTAWYFRTHGAPDAAKRDFQVAEMLDRTGKSQPLDLPSAEFRDFETYNAMTYTKPAAVYRMLQAYLGDDVFGKGLHLYYERNKLHHVTLADFQAAMEEASGQDLDWFFDEWFHTTKTLDYSVQSATTRQQPDGSWLTSVEVARQGEAWMPVVVQVGSLHWRLEGHEAVQRINFITARKPAEVVLDPDTIILDVDRSNNRQAL